jgi:hypothetical protein
MKTIEFSLYVDSAYYVDNRYTGKSFPAPNESHLEEFFNHVTLCWGITNNYANIQIESHLRRNESFKAFLKAIYQID